MVSLRICVVSLDQFTISALQDACEKEGHIFHSFSDKDAFLAHAEKNSVDACFFDHMTTGYLALPLGQYLFSKNPRVFLSVLYTEEDVPERYGIVREQYLGIENQIIDAFLGKPMNLVIARAALRTAIALKEGRREKNIQPKNKKKKRLFGFLQSEEIVPFCVACPYNKPEEGVFCEPMEQIYDLPCKRIHT